MKNIYSPMKKTIAVLSLAMAVTGSLHAQQPEVKIDLNMNGRPAAEVQEPGYTPWVVTKPLSDTLVVNGITFIVQKGQRGVSLAPTYYKAGIQEGTFNTRFTNDGLTVKDGDFASGASIVLIIKGLPAGNHTLVTYHNMVDNLLLAAVCPIDVYVDSVLVVDDLVPTVRVYKTTECQATDLQITAQANKDVVILIKADTTGSQAVKNVILNGLHLNGVNVGRKSRSPIPAHREEHLDVPIGGSYLLRWERSPIAVSHDIYFGTDSLAVATATRTSPLFKKNQGATDTSFAVTNLYTMDKYYWRIDEVTPASTAKGDVWFFRTRQLAFPGAEGYGRFARGGRGGRVVEVTNLNDNGPGSLREAITNDIGPRTIVFTVSGVITLQSRLVLSQPYVTIAGQTAPGKGICVRSAPLGITGNDAIVRHMRVRIGAGPTYDGMGLTGANHSIMDHCSISWTIDEAFSSRGGKNITLQRTLISEALNVAGHQNYPAGTAHGYAATIGGDVGSFHHNLLAHNQGRNWSMGGGLDGNGYYSGRLDMSNNVVYNWGGRTTDGGAHEVNFLNNYYKPGPAARIFVAFTLDHEGVGKGSQRCYFNGNVMPGRFNENNQLAGRRMTISNNEIVNYETFADSAFFPSEVILDPAYTAYKKVLSDVGATQPVFDDHDTRMVLETRDSTYSAVGSVTGLKGLIDHENDQGGFEDYPSLTRPANWDTDHDGMPDWWETLKGLDPNSPAGDFSESNADNDMNGFTNLEYYLNWMAEAHFSATGTQPIVVDLRKLAAGFKSTPVFTVGSAVNGQVTQSNGVAQFVPAQTGFGSFGFTVTDAEGTTMTRTIHTASGVNMVLPVTVTSFEATRKNAGEVALTWKTAQETNSSHFEIERSFSGRNDFVKTGNSIFSKAINGSSSNPLEYEMTDFNASSSDCYYRLVQKDRDGKSTVSGIRLVKGSNHAGLQVWPVPNNGRFSVLLTNSVANCQLMVYDAMGRLYATHPLSGGTAKALDIKTPGRYTLKVVGKQDSKILFTQTVLVN